MFYFYIPACLLKKWFLFSGRIKMVYPENKAADEHFENLRKQYAGTVARAKTLVDEATDSKR